MIEVNTSIKEKELQFISGSLFTDNAKINNCLIILNDVIGEVNTLKKRVEFLECLLKRK